MTATEQEGRAQRVDTLLRPTEEAFDAKRRWRKAAEEIADEALGFDTKRAWRKALASRGAKSYDGLVVATVEYEDGGLADDGTHIWKPHGLNDRLLHACCSIRVTQKGISI